MRRSDEPDAAGASLEGAVLVGNLLRNRRQSRGLTPEEVGLALRVGARHVLAVEEGRFADLPPQPYARGLVSSYATLLGLDPGDLLQACGPSLSGEGRGRAARIFRYPAREKFIWREWAVPFALAAVVSTIVVARAVLAPAPIELEVPVSAPALVQRPFQQTSAQAEAPPAVGQTPVGETSAEQTATEQTATEPGVRVVLRCEGTTWAEAAADGGQTRRYELGPGQNLTLTARGKLSLALGDAGVLRLRVNERELGFIGDKGEMKSGLLFTASRPPPVAAPPAVAGD